ncbi:MAG: AMP-binding protein [Nostoc sp.]
MTNHIYDSTDTPPNFTTVVDLLRYRAIYQPQQTAYTFLVDGETQEVSITYQELDLQSQNIAAYLQFLGARGERALLLFHPGLEYIVAFFACLYAGVVAVPAYPPRRNQKMSRLKAIIADAQPKVLLTTEALLTNINQFTSEPELARLRCLAIDKIEEHQASWQKTALESSTLAFLQYTSGSTGTPKGVMVSHGNLLHNSALIYKCFEHTLNSKGVIWLPPYHDMGLIGGVLQPLYGGFPVILMSPENFLQKPLRWLTAISHYKATTSGGPNFAYELCANKITDEQKATLDLSSWQVAFNGAEQIRAETQERFAAAFAGYGFRSSAFYPCYGMAETTLIVSGGLKEAEPVLEIINRDALEQKRVVPASQENYQAQKLVSCGHLLEQQIIIAHPETLTCCLPNEVGEIWVSGSSVAQGYWNLPEETQRTFQAYLADTKAGPFLRTGDLGFLKDGELFVTGRLKDLIIIRGRNHYPQDIELTVERSHPALRQGYGAAFSVDVDGEERLVIAFEVERSYLRNLDVNEVVMAIREAVRQQHEILVYAILLLKTGSIPKTSSGKIQRHACRSGFQAVSLDVVADWTENPQSKVEQHLQPEVKYLSEQVQAPEQKTQLNGNNFGERSHLPLAPTEQTIQHWLVTQIANQLNVHSDEIDIQEPFVRYGLDSAVVLGLCDDLAQWLGYNLEPTIFWDYPNIETLARYLVKNSSLSLNNPSC